MTQAAPLETVAGQFGAAVDMLENAIIACPDEHWGDADDWQAFWYLASHTLFWLDRDLSEAPDRHPPPAPFGLEELDPNGVLPPRVHTKVELLAVLAGVRSRFRTVFAGFTAAQAARPSTFRPGTDFTMLEQHLYCLRHVQHHVGQLQLLLRQAGVTPPRWVSRGTR